MTFVKAYIGVQEIVAAYIGDVPLIPEITNFDVWDFQAPSQSTSIAGFAVGFESGSVSGNWGAGDQALQNNEPINITL
jgi:hypothetical protein